MEYIKIEYIKEPKVGQEINVIYPDGKKVKCYIASLWGNGEIREIKRVEIDQLEESAASKPA